MDIKPEYYQPGIPKMVQKAMAELQMTGDINKGSMKRLDGLIGTYASVPYLYTKEGERIIFDNKEHLDWYVGISLDDLVEKIKKVIRSQHRSSSLCDMQDKAIDELVKRLKDKNEN